MERDYRHAELSFQKLLKDPQKQKIRRHWMMCIKRFRSVYVAQPNGTRADDALFMAAHLYAKLYEFSGNIHDKHEALDYFNRLLKRFPESPHRSKANRAIDALTKKINGQKTISGLQTGVLAEVKGIRFWSSSTYTRVVIDVESEVRYIHRLLKKDPAIEKPERLYIDLNRARIGPGVKPFVPISNALLSDAHAAEHGPDAVRIVLDIRSADHFKVFSLRNPFRIVVDVRGVPLKTASKRRFKNGMEKQGVKLPKGALVRQLALGVKRIVIDPGHGGKDPGASGYLKGLMEKNVTLEVAERLARKIRQKLGCEVTLTRNADTNLSLEERTAIANTNNADLFISIHTNAHKKMASRGIETYFLNLATDEDAVLVAARENATSAKNISDLEDILSDLMKNAKQEESMRLAGYVQDTMIKKLRPRYGEVKNNGVKQAPFYVLMGAEMPCILVEVAFITNPRECRRLNTAGYQDDMADAIAAGIQHYTRDIRPPVLTQAEIRSPGK
ncbi:MAG: N-acetylmuramoyl-L-alanine amidase [Desulfobacterales bacterium]|nr:MAG: N-acetylmuramoyl-L-alanine amidase [Desulfobacterales bacterium]